MRRVWWLSTPLELRACTSVREAVARGNPGDLIHAQADGKAGPASLATYRIETTRAGRKVAVRMPGAR